MKAALHFLISIDVTARVSAPLPQLKRDDIDNLASSRYSRAILDPVLTVVGSCRKLQQTTANHTPTKTSSTLLIG